jgi:hypothetical protein
MRRLFLVLMALGLCAAPTPVMGASPEPSGGPPSTDALAVDAIRSSDARFADLQDYADVSRQMARDFDIMPLVAGSWIHVLPTFDQYTGASGLFNDPAWTGLGRVVEIMLVADCPTHITAVAATDPCGWRHTWLYRVTPAGEVMALGDAGS